MPKNTDPVTRLRIERLFVDVRGVVEDAYREWLAEGRPVNLEKWRERIVPELPPDFQVVKMTARPFGFRFHCGQGIDYQIACNARTYRWWRVTPLRA